MRNVHFLRLTFPSKEPTVARIKREYAPKSPMTRNLLVFSLSAAVLSSCIINQKNIVPDMPHNASWRQRAQQEAMAARTYTTTQAPEQTPKPQATPTAPTATAATTTTTAPVATPTATPPAKTASSHITTPAAVTPQKPVATVPQPVATPTPTAVVAAPVPVSKPATKQDLRHITNEGQEIPYAKRVPGDPTRVYNPLAPELTIRTIDRATGKPLPRGTILKVNGTEFKFKVP